MTKEPKRHLGTAGVVRAQKQHRGFAVVVQTFDLGQRTQPLPGEPFGHQRQELADGGGVGEPVVGGMQEPVDGVGPKTPSNSSARPVAACLTASD
jgi:hypothetical protein